MAARGEKKVPARPRRTKAEVQEQFQALAETLAAEEPVDDKSRTLAAQHEAEVRASVAGIDVAAVVQRVGALGLDLTRALSDMSERLTAEVRLLTDLREAVAIERREIERLHRIDLAATALDQLVAEHEQKRQDLEREIAETRASWAAEAQKSERERREQEEVLKRQRQREIEEYDYKKTLERKKAADKLDEEARQLERKNTERQQALEKSWAEREAALKEREDDIARLETEVAQFPDRIARAIDATTAEVRAEVAAEFERQLLVMRKDAEAEARVAALAQKTMEQSLATAAARIAALETQLAEAKSQVQEIAVRAIEGASGARALSHVNQIAIEQAKNRPQG
jgi:DNA repair exonuclease SbcCD ATPase subunit